MAAKRYATFLKTTPVTVTFKGEYISFWTRLAKKLAPIILVLAFLFLKVEYGKTFSGNFKEYKISFYIFGIACFFIGLFYHIRDIRTVVTEVSFTNDELKIFGFDFNKRFEDTLDINQTMLEIKEKEKTKKPYLEIYSNDKYYYINNYSDWRKEILVQLVKEYKVRTDKTIFGIESFPELMS